MSAALYNMINSTIDLETKTASPNKGTSPTLRAQKKCLDSPSDFLQMDYAYGIMNDYGGMSKTVKEAKKDASSQSDYCEAKHVIEKHIPIYAEQPGGLRGQDASSQEPILVENPTRFTLFPIQKHSLYKKYKDHISVFWHADEVDLAKDTKDWNRLSADEQHFIKYVLAFFAGSDGIVMENLGGRFMREVQIPESRAFYAIQMAIEEIHG